MKSHKKDCHWNTFLFDLCLVLFPRIWLKVKIVQIYSRRSWTSFTRQITSIQKKQIMLNCSWRNLSQAQLRFIKINFLGLALLKDMVIVFTISHVQSQIERGFSINKEVIIVNLENKSLCAQWLVYDALKCFKKDAHDIEITAKMVTSCKFQERCAWYWNNCQNGYIM